MFTRKAVVAILASGLLILFGCGDGGDDYYNQIQGAAGGGASLDIAGTYSVDPDDFGFNMLTIYQSGGSLTAADNGGGSWSGSLTNTITEETTGAGGSAVMTWRGDVNLTGKNAVGDNVSLRGVVEITPTSGGANLVLITAEYENLSIGLPGQLLLTQTSAMPGGIPGAAGAGDGSGAGNK